MQFFTALTASSSHWQCTVNVLIIADMARGADGAEFLSQISTLTGIWTMNLSIDNS